MALVQSLGMSDDSVMRITLMPRLRVVGLVLLGLVVGCVQPGPDERLATPDAPAGFQNLSLKREGGLTGGADRLLINNTGAVAASGRTWGSRQARLSRQRMAELTELLSGFHAFNAMYPPPEGARDDHRYLIVYGASVVRVSDANPQVPEQLRVIIRELERLAEEVEAQ